MKCIYELILENYTRQICLFQSPRSGKFVSNGPCQIEIKCVATAFQSPRSGKFVSNRTCNNNSQFNNPSVSIPQVGEICIRLKDKIIELFHRIALFQSPRSGKFVSNSLLNNPVVVKQLQNVSIPQIGEICIRYY